MWVDSKKHFSEDDMVRTAQPSHLEMPQLTALLSTNDDDDDDDDDGYISVRKV